MYEFMNRNRNSTKRVLHKHVYRRHGMNVGQVEKKKPIRKLMKKVGRVGGNCMFWK